MSKEDSGILNTFLHRMNAFLSLKDINYINSIENKEDILYEGCLQQFLVEIQGYKISPNGKLTPIWRILPDSFY